MTHFLTTIHHLKSLNRTYLVFGKNYLHPHRRSDLFLNWLVDDNNVPSLVELNIITMIRIPKSKGNRISIRLKNSFS